MRHVAARVVLAVGALTAVAQLPAPLARYPGIRVETGAGGPFLVSGTVFSVAGGERVCEDAHAVARADRSARHQGGQLTDTVDTRCRGRPRLAICRQGSLTAPQSLEFECLRVTLDIEIQVFDALSALLDRHWSRRQPADHFALAVAGQQREQISKGGTHRIALPPSASPIPGTQDGRPLRPPTRRPATFHADPRRTSATRRTLRPACPPDGDASVRAASAP